MDAKNTMNIIHVKEERLHHKWNIKEFYEWEKRRWKFLWRLMTKESKALFTKELLKASEIEATRNLLQKWAKNKWKNRKWVKINGKTEIVKVNNYLEQHESGSYWSDLAYKSAICSRLEINDL